MPYATESEMTERFGVDEVRQLTDRELPAAGNIVTSVLNRALSDADSIINRHLGQRFTVPLSSPYPTDLVRVACDIARYLLHDLSAPETVRDHYTDALRYLRELAEGKLPLVTSTGDIVPAKGTSFGSTAVRQYPSSAIYGDSFAAAWRP